VVSDLSRAATAMQGEIVLFKMGLKLDSNMVKTSSVDG